MGRYETLFAELRTKGEGAFVPFFMLGDPSYEASLELIRAAVNAGADALEIGIPFSDPVADGPEIEKSHQRALRGGASLDKSMQQLRQIREEFPETPIGLLVYCNLAVSKGTTEFYQSCAAAGADSILIPDVPTREGGPFVAAAQQAGISQIFIAPARADDDTLRAVSENSSGYIYALSRHGVTGADKEAESGGLDSVVDSIKRFDGPPVLLGFGISKPEHVRAALDAGAAGAITGSAITRIISAGVESSESGNEFNLADLADAVSRYVAEMKAATR